MIAATGAVTEVAALSRSYLAVRALAQPALLVSLVTQSCLLAQRDAKSPALAIGLQIAVNAVLDVGLVAGAGAGVVGAAWATVAAQYMGAALLLRRLAASPGVRYAWRAGMAPAAVRLARELAPLVVVYVSRNLCYLMLQARTRR